MPPPFVRITPDGFTDLLQRFNFTRRIDSVHLHHTWRPTHAQYREEASVDAMWRYHTTEKGWSDIAQHVSVGPDGSIWSGRDWNRPPVSAAGYNGNAAVGPFMLEMIGDFDEDRDMLEGAQLEAVVDVITRVQQRFSLKAESLRFHRSMTTQKSCPGSGIDWDAIKSAVEAARGALGSPRGEQPAETWAGPESLQDREGPDAVIRAWQRAVTTDPDPADAELEESLMTEEEQTQLHARAAGTVRAAPGTAKRAARGPELSPDMLSGLRAHVVNLNQGYFSENGVFRTSKADVDGLFDDHLVRAAEAARIASRPLRLLFWAHGGLISEATGLGIAQQQVSWWKKNDIYPIHFVWETGFMDALKQILSGARERAARAVPRDLWDYTVDPALELAARALGGAKIWSAMKRSAELAAAPAGGATYVASKLSEFCKSQAAEVELHAVGHSAGSIFHSHFLPVAFELGVPPFKTLQLLAPAIRIDAFKSRLLPHIGQGIQSLRMFTMQRDWEDSDHVAQLYQKSLLYLIHYALEAERKTPILGLEISLRDDGDLVNLFGLSNQPAPHAEIVWSVTEAMSGAHASTSQSHGGFDNDRATMDSVAHRILGAPPAVALPDEAIQRGIDAWVGMDAPFEAAPPAGTSAGAIATAATSIPAAGAPQGRGKRRALCVGIDRYPTMPLAGCVADAREWSRTLQTLGFETKLLLDEAATRNRVLEDLRALLASGLPGDVLAFQFAGHGTELVDIDGDEVDGTNGPRDEALCPYDIAHGAFIIDDDLAEVFSAIPHAVNVTCFIDCCHSGSVTRLMVGSAGADGLGDRRARFLPATPEMHAAHRAFRQRLNFRGRSIPRRTPAEMRQVVFSACRDHEVAFESDGHGDFTVRATQLLLPVGLEGLTHEEFQRRVTTAFGDAARQHPELDCAPPARTRALLASLVTRPNELSAVRAGPDWVGAPPGAAIAQALRALADTLVPAS